MVEAVLPLWSPVDQPSQQPKLGCELASAFCSDPSKRKDLQLLRRLAASPQSPQATGPARFALLCSTANLQVEAPSDTRRKVKVPPLLRPRWLLEGRVQVS